MISSGVFDFISSSDFSKGAIKSVKLIFVISSKLFPDKLQAFSTWCRPVLINAPIISFSYLTTIPLAVVMG